MQRKQVIVHHAAVMPEAFRLHRYHRALRGRLVKDVDRLHRIELCRVRVRECVNAHTPGAGMVQARIIPGNTNMQ